jgi:hypothetical protein
MHGQALEWVAFHAKACGDPLRVLDLGGRDVNGSPRVFFPGFDYVTLDVLPGADITADAASWEPSREYGVVISTETFEHAQRWRDICVTAFKACAPGGTFIVTCAGPGREPHSGVDGHEVREWEWYANVSTDELHAALVAAGWSDIVTDSRGFDTRAVARKADR